MCGQQKLADNITLVGPVMAGPSQYLGQQVGTIISTDEHTHIAYNKYLWAHTAKQLE